MSLVALDGTPLIPIGTVGLGMMLGPGTSNTTQDAANEATHMIGDFFWSDGGTHTVSTAGSSSMGWRTGARTFANAGTTFKVGVATVDTATGPPGRATNVTDVVTLSVSKSYTSAAPMTANSWNESVPDAGSISIATGDTIAFVTQMTARGGADSIVTTCGTLGGGSASFPFKTDFTGGAYAGVNALPNCVLTASDGTLGWFYGSSVFTTASNARTYGSGSSPNEFGNLFALPFPCKVYGIIADVSLGGDTNFNLYSSPLGTPVAEKTKSMDANVIKAAATLTTSIALFSSPYSAKAEQQLGAVLTPTTATTITNNFVTLNSATHQAAYPGGANGYAISRSSGAFAAVNSSKDRQYLGLLIGALSQENSQLINSQSLVG